MMEGVIAPVGNFHAYRKRRSFSVFSEKLQIIWGKRKAPEWHLVLYKGACARCALQSSDKPLGKESHVASEEFAPMLEELARDVHETWMRGRLSEGWKLGPERNDSLREHPSLIPYEQLSE